MEVAIRTLSSRPLPVERFLSAYVDVPKFLACCRQCPNFGRRGTCPPYDFAPEDYWQRWHTVSLSARQISFAPGDRLGNAREGLEVLHREKDRFLQDLLRQEAQLPGSMALSPGACERCDPCPMAQGAPCCHPETFRYSMESLGGNVAAAARDQFGLELLWAKGEDLPPYYLLIGGLFCLE